MASVTKQFYLVGEDASTARSIDVIPQQDLKKLKTTVGEAFHICEPSGIEFQTTERGLDDVDAIVGSPLPIGITVDGAAVRDPPSPEGYPIVGNFYEIYPDHLGNHARLFNKLGSVIKTNSMGKINYLTDDPAVAGFAFSESAYFTKLITREHPLYGIKDNTAIFIGDTETENWRLAHKFIPPCLSPKAVRHYTPLMQQTVRESFKTFDAMDDAAESWNVYQFMLKLASQTIGKFTLGMDFAQFEGPESPLHPVVTSIATMLSLNKRVAARAEWYRKLPFGDPQRLRDVQQKVYGFVSDAMKDAKSSGKGDLPLHDAALEAANVADYITRATDEKGQKLPENLAVSNLVVVTGAGFTTISTLLSWMIYAAVTYPREQDRLLQELVDHGINNETTWDPDLVQSLAYMDKFVKETQRLHNPSYQPGRTTKQEVIVPGGYRLPANSVLIPALYAIHTNPKHWENPQRFQPDRWDTPEVKKRHRCAYIPFATGPRGCIGFNFALQEAKVLFPELLYRYEFSRESWETVEYDPEFQLVRPLNFYVRARRRTTWPEKSA
ncbi:cytochrome P450 [Saccharata proteae CBS 121410]|uniref:Cytochrome P450 n=1 Tax=Saccharata proteae CBS 121410 TaxID=1314787 RepID=A0A9P4I1H8_9PEZI|nr:cytochrome P450 [Saccharata proteae CBS 121410]